MKKNVPIALLFALAFAVPAYAGTLQPGGMITGGNFWPALPVGIGWVANGLSPQAKIRVTLMRNGAPLRVLGSGLPLNNEDPPQTGPIILGHIYWTPAAGDIGCNYAARVEAEDGSAAFTSQPFGVFAAMNFPTKGAPSNVRLDQPTEGKVLVLGQRGLISWSLIADAKLWPSKKLKLELFWENSKVGDIAEVNLDFGQCPVRGSYTWPVGKLTGITDYARIPNGKSLIPGNNYWVRASGDGSSYFGPSFVIAASSNLPLPGTAPKQKLPVGGVVPGKPLD